MKPARLSTLDVVVVALYVVQSIATCIAGPAYSVIGLMHWAGVPTPAIWACIPISLCVCLWRYMRGRTIAIIEGE